MNTITGIIFEGFALFFLFSCIVGYFIAKPKKLIDWLPFLMPILGGFVFSLIGFDLIFK